MDNSYLKSNIDFLIMLMENRNNLADKTYHRDQMEGFSQELIFDYKNIDKTIIDILKEIKEHIK